MLAAAAWSSFAVAAACPPDPRGVAEGCLEIPEQFVGPGQGQTPELKRPTEHGPPVEGAAARETDGDRAPPQQAKAPASIVRSEVADLSGDPCKGDPDCYQRRNLNAQEQTAEWAFWTMAATWGQVGIAVIGTFVVFRTLRLSRQATRAAVDASNIAAEGLKAAERSIDEQRRLGEAQVRCYVSLHDVEISLGDDEPVPLGIPAGNEVFGDTRLVYPKIFFEVRNAGQSPAIRVNWKPSIKYMAYSTVGGEMRATERQSVRNFPMSAADRAELFVDDVPAGDSRPFSGMFGFGLNDVENNAISLPQRDGGTIITLVISLRYEDVFHNVLPEDFAFTGVAQSYILGSRIKMRRVQI